jgi:predicted alpha/beta-fold hydrolase
MINKSTFKPGWGLSNPHVQTMWQSLFRRQPEVLTQRERFVLPDGDFLDLDWAGYDGEPIVLVLHGIAGSIESPYAKGMLRAVVEYGWRGAVMHFRGCSGEPNRLPRIYHSGETDDLQILVSALHKRHPNNPIAVVGFSMGGNVLLKWLGETGESNPLVAAVAVSVPLELEKSADHINHGLHRFYQWWLLRDLRKRVADKFRKNKQGSPVDVEEIENIQSMLDFDNRITAPLHGFTDARDYYTKSSALQYLKQIRTPTLILHATDDPFMTTDTFVSMNDLSPNLTFELSATGGHVGFVGGTPWKPEYWLEQRIPEFLRVIFKK